MSAVVISGYASLDHAIVLGGDVVFGRTTIISSRPTAWPRLGGGPAYVASALVAGGIAEVRPLSWVGEDDLGRRYKALLAERGIATQGVAAVPGTRTPVSVLVYNGDGDCACLYDPGQPAEELRLDASQRGLLGDADWVVMTIGPKVVTDEILALLHPRQRLAWIVKNDPAAITAAQSAAFFERADIVFCNGKERHYLDSLGAPAGLPDRIVVETQGRRGATLSRDGETVSVAAEAVEATDPTGAGDSFAGGVLAALLGGQTRLDALGVAGVAAARALLTTRLNEEG